VLGYSVILTAVSPSVWTMLLLAGDAVGILHNGSVDDNEENNDKLMSSALHGIEGTRSAAALVTANTVAWDDKYDDAMVLFQRRIPPPKVLYCKASVTLHPNVGDDEDDLGNTTAHEETYDPSACCCCWC
jgi:hypothetical protein